MSRSVTSYPPAIGEHPRSASLMAQFMSLLEH